MLDLATHPAAVNLDKVRHQRRNVFAAVAQRRQQNGKHVQTVVEIAAKLTPIRHLHQITICGSHQPNVDLMSAGAAQALELLFLQNAQQLRLQRRRNVAHFIQEKRALVGQFETADLLRDGSGERTLLVAKEFTLQQIQWNGSAIQPYESVVRTAS